MVVRRPANIADQELSFALAAKGATASPRQLERMRQWGLLAESRRAGRGRGRGSVSIRAADELDRAQEACRLVAEHDDLGRATLAMFAAGEYPVAKDKLDRAYVSALTSLRKLFEKHGRHARTPLEVALNAASSIARHAVRDQDLRALRRRLIEDRPQTPVRRLIEHAAAEAVSIMLTGHAVSPEGLLELLTVVGTTEVLKNPVTGQYAETLRVEDVGELTPHMSLANVERRARTSSLTQLERARDDLKAFRALAHAYGEFIHRMWGGRSAFGWLVAASMNDLAIAYAAPTAVWIRQRYGRELDDMMARTRIWTPGFTAGSLMLDTLPREYRHVFARSGAHHELGADDRAEVRRRLDQFEANNPSAYNAIMAMNEAT